MTTLRARSSLGGEVCAKCNEQNIIIKIGKVFKIIIIASIKDQRRRAGCRGLAGLRKGFVAFFYKKPETSEKAKGWGGASRGAGAPLSGGHLPKGGGGRSLRSMLWGPPEESHEAQKPTAFSETFRGRQAGGCGAPEHPWVWRKNKTPHPLLSGLNNRWPLASSFYQREGNQNARLLFVASLDLYFLGKGPEKIKITQEPYSGGENEDPVLISLTFQKPCAAAPPRGPDTHAQMCLHSPWGPHGWASK